MGFQAVPMGETHMLRKDEYQRNGPPQAAEWAVSRLRSLNVVAGAQAPGSNRHGMTESPKVNSKRSDGTHEPGRQPTTGVPPEQSKIENRESRMGEAHSPWPWIILAVWLAWLLAMAYMGRTEWGRPRAVAGQRPAPQAPDEHDAKE
ncbi:MAG: hypothetical protein NTW87_29600 [Planctomycetota bacterium]|nr:hypothetical protein [Planctomycetota bacterium]